MTLSYPYRFIYAMIASFFLIAVGFICDLNPMLVQIHSLHRTHDRLIKKQLKVKQWVNSLAQQHPVKSDNHPTHPDDSLPVLTDLFLKGEIPGLTLESMSIDVSEAMIAHLVVQGDFQSMMAFMMMLIQHQALQINHFALRVTDQSRLSLNIDVMLLNSPITPSPTMEEPLDFPVQHNPFCMEEHVVSESYRENQILLQSVPLQQIKVVGIVQQNPRIEAWVVLPNHAVLAVHRGMVIGQEHALIIRIQSDRLMLKLPNHADVMMTMAS